jgi:Family of unknown function (DUF5683)
LRALVFLLLIVLAPGLSGAQDAAPAAPDSSTLDAPTLNRTAVDLEPIDIWDNGVSATGAVLMTPLFPGWGQLYSDNSWRAALAFGVEMFYWTNMLMRDRRAIRAKEFSLRFESGSREREFYDAQATENWEQVRDFAWWSGGVLLIIALDAYVGAHLFQFDENAMPVPNDWDGQFGYLGEDMPGAVSAPTFVVFQWGYNF